MLIAYLEFSLGCMTCGACSGSRRARRRRKKVTPPITSPAGMRANSATRMSKTQSMPRPMPRPTATSVIERGIAFWATRRYLPGWPIVKCMAVWPSCPATP